MNARIIVTASIAAVLMLGAAACGGSAPAAAKPGLQNVRILEQVISRHDVKADASYGDSFTSKVKCVPTVPNTFACSIHDVLKVDNKTGGWTDHLTIHVTPDGRSWFSSPRKDVGQHATDLGWQLLVGNLINQQGGSS